ncbi:MULTISPECIES: flagellar basal-body MS-ring/collar protein FliF [unclassified Rhizobacter]|uniref:flagellar basal-body MS-ring/collar protein FliF n=1 Tax=unclassified Rhizobacter TaxID=2640088 RepID=UPI0006FE070F|nr:MULTISPECIES: flagellar basal-body MS-ring/collar protein FliF [unclassified Rhizobacter]KQU71351.1 flagellar M-ring protein FliF [Rhizobacter sp. Root29]KQW10654.1 flagellar M-ring protein FliF [Rhizobacter sp. Root1238]KRB25422.1 flagellar M-ring protein FliF [Rhizobacter sp. Root16D2]
MDNAVTLANPSQLPVPAGFGARLAALPAKSKASLGLGIAALIAVLAAITLWSSQGDYKVLYANLSEKDGGAIIAQLSQMNVPYRYSDGGGAILVPSAQVHDLRLKLASAGLPKGSIVGFELMDGAKFGQTQFQERLTFQRGLEGELTRSITAMSAVQNARVHLALPNQNGFFREQQKPSASVMLTLHPGRTLDRSQIAGIVHLVSSSVPEMNPKAVSVLDQTGTLLSAAPDASNGAGLDAQQLQYVNQIEASYNKRILDILEPVIGRDNLRAQVTADIDFSQVESTAEEFKPNQGENAQASVRSQQSSEQMGQSGAGATGIPGAASNQPPVPATAPVTGAAQPLQTAQNGAASNTNSRKEAVTNYEVDKTVRVTRNATGTVKRLNAAVVVNHRSVTDAKGKTTTVPLTPDEIEKLNVLVRESIGFKQERGDSVKVINAPFRIEKIEPDTTPIWKQPQTLDMLRAAAVPASLALVAMVIVFGLIRPALKAALPQPVSPADARGNTLNAMVDDAEALPKVGNDADAKLPMLEAPRISPTLIAARAYAKDNPAAVASIVRDWVSGEAA